MNFFFWIKLWSEERRDDADSFREIIHHHKKYIQKHKKGKWDRQWHNSILYYTISPSFFFSVIILKICFIILVNMTSLIETGSAAIPKKYHETLGKILFTEEMIEKRITEMAAQISKDYEGEEILIVGLLKGAILFVADLVRKLTVPSSINFIIASSYGHGVSIK